jgi:hypothetical protein
MMATGLDYVYTVTCESGQTLAHELGRVCMLIAKVIEIRSASEKSLEDAVIQRFHSPGLLADPRQSDLPELDGYRRA